MKKPTKKTNVRDLKPKKDAKGGGGGFKPTGAAADGRGAAADGRGTAVQGSTNPN
jgi:hypothetical protein